MCLHTSCFLSAQEDDICNERLIEFNISLDTAWEAAAGRARRTALESRRRASDRWAGEENAAEAT